MVNTKAAADKFAFGACAMGDPRGSRPRVL